jgi:predicted RNase H-like HicB family nuclease
VKYAYTAVFIPEAFGAYSVYFPDLPGLCTCGDDIPDAVKMAQDALCLWLYDMEQDKRDLPMPRSPQSVSVSEGAFTSVVAADTDQYRRYFDAKKIRRTVSIPMWLNEQAERAQIDFTQVMCKALQLELKMMNLYKTD